ncbi:hypothetical protein U9M48_031096 [Paspalum notatum var. saurae]|uniref:Uncharacterized protein n=1 Tax=Paspalum notatum var. saurae TaxID=547442 RepID=A0AAQ3X3C8_PASNO
MMAMGGYFRAPRRLSYGGWKHQHAENKESLRAALLVDDDEAGAGAGVVVPKGYFAVYVGAEATRFVVPTSYLRQPAFRGLMERAAEEFGFDQAGGLRVRCREEDFQATVAVLERRRRWRRTSAGARSGGKTNNTMVKAC